MATYPTPLHSQSYDTGPVYLKYLRLPKDWKSITVFSEFEDGGVDVLEHADDAPIRWEITYDGLEDEDANILDEFFEAHRYSVPFTFIEPRDHPWTGGEGNTYTDVYFEDYIRDHTQISIQSRIVKLVRRPA